MKLKPHVKAFWSSYLRCVTIVWDQQDNNPDRWSYEVRKDGAVIGTSEDATLTDKWPPFHRPYEWDHDRMTNLFWKFSRHELSMRDYDVQKFQRYRYTVIRRDSATGGEWESDEMEVYID